MFLNMFRAFLQGFSELQERFLMLFAFYRKYKEFYDKNSQVVVQFGYHIGKMKFAMTSRVIPLYGYGNYDLQYRDGIWVFINHNDKSREFVLNEKLMFIHTDDDFEILLQSIKTLTAKHYPHQLPPGMVEKKIFYN